MTDSAQEAVVTPEASPSSQEQTVESAQPEKRRALIFGVAGQDGSHLADYLLSKGYEVFGVARRHASMGHPSYLYPAVSAGLRVIPGDILDAQAVTETILRVEPTEVYNLAAASFVGSSWAAAPGTMAVNALGALNILEAVRLVDRDIRVYQASSSEMFGNTLFQATVQETPLCLYSDDAMNPRSPYGVSKLAAHRMADVYRQSHGMFVACGIAFNHESERRGIEFVTKKIAMGVAAIRAGRVKHIPLGSLDAYRDWGYAPEYVMAMHAMLQLDEPRDIILATGQAYSVRKFLTLALEAAGLEGDVEEYVQTAGALVRPAEIWRLVGNTEQAKQLLGWRAKTTVPVLVKRMVAHELAQYDIPVDFTFLALDPFEED